MKENQDPKQSLSALPSVNTLLQHPVLLELCNDYSRSLVTEAVRAMLKDIRTGILERSEFPDELSEEVLVQKVKSDIENPPVRVIRPIINATGIILHDAVRAAMMDDIVRDTMMDAMRPGISDVEAQAERILCEITNGGAACLVHSDLAALWLTVDTFGRGREVVISRGHIGAQGPIRMMDLFERCGTRVVEVGATNKTHLKDYRSALNEHTGAIISIRPATYAFRGFAQEVSLEDLAMLGTEYDVPVLLAAGITTLTSPVASDWQPAVTVQAAVQAGVAVTVAGSELTGGPVCGLAVGKPAAIDRMKQNPLAHLLGVGVPIYAGMGAVLQPYDADTAGLGRHPAGRMILASSDVIKARAERLLARCRADLKQAGTFDLIESTAYLTAARLPSEAFSGHAVSWHPTVFDAISLSKKLHDHTPALLTGVTGERIIINLRTVEDPEVDTLYSILTSVLKNTCV